MHIHPSINEWNLHTPLGVQQPFLTKMITKFLNKTGSKWSEMHEAGIDLVCACHFNAFDEWVSMPTDPNPDAPMHAMRMMDLLEETLNTEAAPYARLVRTPDELRNLLDRNATPKSSDAYRVAVLHALEGGHALGGSIKPLEFFAKRGLVYITITHFFFKGIASAVNSYPFFPDADSSHPDLGLTEFGKEVIHKMKELGVIIDVTHCTSTALQHVLDNSQGPLLSSHASARTLGDHPYSHYDEHLKEIAMRGGLAAVIIYPFILTNYGDLSLAEEHGKLEETVRTVRYLYKLFGGHEQIAIGSDYSGYITGPKDLHSISRVYRLRELLLREFDGETKIVDDIMANNGIRFILANWKGGQAL